MVLVLLFWSEGVPPLAEDLGHGAVVLVGIALVDQGPVTLAEDHEGVHRTTDMFLLTLALHEVVTRYHTIQCHGG